MTFAQQVSWQLLLFCLGGTWGPADPRDDESATATAVAKIKSGAWEGQTARPLQHRQCADGMPDMLKVPTFDGKTASYFWSVGGGLIRHGSPTMSFDHDRTTAVFDCGMQSWDGHGWSSNNVSLRLGSWFYFIFRMGFVMLMLDHLPLRC